tara:strand:- start:11929 stop:12387 length:459 start_codon:yes stop_codon:yes gene_type:complete
MVSGGIRKVGAEIKVSFNSSAPKKIREYKDKFPKTLPTLAKVKEKYGTVVWCKFTECKHNFRVEGLQRTSGTILKNRTYQPIGEQEHIWDSVCSRGEIAIQFTQVVSPTHAKVKVPSCFVASTSPSGHIDFSRFLQADGSPLGGNLNSQHDE